MVFSATRCRVDCHRINAGVVTLGESLRPVAARGLVDRKLIYQYELSYDAILQLQYLLCLLYTSDAADE